MTSWMMFLLIAPEVIDRTAAAVDRQVVTTSSIEEQIRIAAFLNNEPLDLSATNRRRTAERIIEQILIRREMEISHYTPPGEIDVDRMLESLRAQRSNFDADLKRYGLGMTALRRNLALQLSSMRFIDLRFRPGNTVTDAEVSCTSVTPGRRSG